jgi:GT2 family glycosyltransferase
VTDMPLPATVLICSRDRPALLLDAVRSVLAAEAVPDELLVVDQSALPNAELGALRGERGCEVRYLHSDSTGLSRARNIGLRAAGSDVVVMLDDDIVALPSWLQPLLGVLDGDPMAVATGRVLATAPEGRGVVVPPAALVTRDTPAVYRGLQGTDVVPGANVALRRDLVLALGGYDERLGAGTRFGAADDNDMGHRLLAAGCEVRHVPAAVVLHRAWRPRGELVRLRWRYGRGKGAFYAKHAGLRDRRMLHRATRDVGGRLRRAVMALARRPRSSAAEILSIVAMLSGALDWLVSERIREARAGHLSVDRLSGRSRHG